MYADTNKRAGSCTSVSFNWTDAFVLLFITKPSSLNRFSLAFATNLQDRTQHSFFFLLQLSVSCWLSSATHVTSAKHQLIQIITNHVSEWNRCGLFLYCQCIVIVSRSYEQWDFVYLFWLLVLPIVTFVWCVLHHFGFFLLLFFCSVIIFLSH